MGGSFGHGGDTQDDREDEYGSKSGVTARNWHWRVSLRDMAVSVPTEAKWPGQARPVIILQALAKPKAAKSMPRTRPKAKRDLPVKSFPTQQAWEAWLKAQPDNAKGLWLKLAKKSAGAPSVSRQDAIDSALCFGWIDGQLDKFDADWWLIRFTPRRPSGNWSANNKKRALELIKAGRMRAAGKRQVELARKDGRWDAAYASQSKATAPRDLEDALAHNKKARTFFAALDSRNRYAVLYRVHTAKTPELRARRIEAYVAMLARGETIHPPKRKPEK